MNMQILQPLIPMLSAMLVAVIADVLLRLVPQARDRVLPLLGLPAGLAGWLKRKLNRDNRAKHVRLNRGIISLLAILFVGTMLGAVCEILAHFHPAVAPVIWFFCLRVTFPWSAGNDVLSAWKTGNNGLEILQRRQVPVLVPTQKPDRHAIARMLIEATATSLHRGWLAPLLWALMAALLHGPAMMIAVMVVFLLEAERVIVTQETQGSAFAFGCETIEAIINFVPARVAALFFALGAFFTPGAKPFTALRAMFTQSAAHRAVNSGWPVAAVAGALHVALPGGRKRDLWIGTKDATAKAEARDIQKAVWLHAVTMGLTALVFTALLLLSIGA